MHFVTVVYCVFVLTSVTSLCAYATGPHRRPLKYAGMTFTNERYCPLVAMGSPASQASLAHLATTGANYVSLVVTQYQDDVNTTTIYSLKDPVPCTATPNGYCLTVNDADLIKTIIFIKQVLGLKVLLKLQIDLVAQANPTYWRGYIGTGMNSSWWDAWFESYTTVLLHYASLAQQLDVDMFSVSCELVVASAQEAHWRTLIARVREKYSGEITASANWAPPGGHGEVVDKLWWDAVDVIGVDEYYVSFEHRSMLANGSFPSLDDLLRFWEPIEVQLEALHHRWNRSVVFTEVGYCSGFNGTCFKNLPPSAVTPPPSEATLNAQSLQFEATLVAMTKHSWWQGVFWWNWATDPFFGGPNNSCMDPKFKPAEDTLRYWYNATAPKPVWDNKTMIPTCRCWL